MSASSPIRVLFLFERPESWINVHRLWRVMTSDPSFATEVWVVPPAAVDDAARDRQVAGCLAVCRELGVPGEPWPAAGEVPPGRFGVAIFTLPYDRGRPPELYFDEVARRVRFTVYVPYGLVTGDGEKNRRLQYAQPAQRRADLVVARSPAEKRAYRRLCPSGDRHVAVLGLPRLDELFDLAAFPIDPALLAQIDGRPAFLWSSHYSFLPRFEAGEAYSTFDRVGAALLTHAASHPEIALIWRPHPHLLPEMVGSGTLRDSELEPFCREIEALGVILDRRPDHRHAFAASSALLSDAGSFLFEYLATGKPVLYLRNPDGAPLNEEASDLVEHYQVAETGEEAIAFLDGQIRHGDLLRERRLAATPRFLPRFDGRAAERVADRVAAAFAATDDVAVGRLDRHRFPLVARVVDSLEALRSARATRPSPATALGRSRTVAREWIMGHVTEHPRLLRGISGALARLGVRKASGG